MNTRERFQAAAALFVEAANVSPERLPAFLDQRCAGDRELRADVLELLDAREDPSVFRTLEERLGELREGLRDQLTEIKSICGRTMLIDGPRPHSESAGEIIDKFRLIEPIGEGGFGRVWLAEQREPVQRRVALKVIKAGMDTAEVLARFDAERQALAVMDHPSVAKVFDAGVTTSGRPYFVMEHVPGLPITSFCDESRLRLRQRLELFITVCEAVNHAHQKGIIHRDLKPSNILVMLVDGRPLPKVIDFGIAKATASALTDHSLHTEMGRLMGTPEYMSPEQADGGNDIDTRSDIYSLGVMLYQLLTGTLPFHGRMLREAGAAGIAKIIREVEPPKPSTRLSSLVNGDAPAFPDVTPARIAEQQGTDTRSLQREVRGELDWIVMKCLEKDRSRRYESANQLAADVRHFLSREPVLAAPPSRIYRVKKFARRHRGFVGTAGAVGAALLIGLVGFAWQAAVAGGQRDRAVLAEQETAKRANELQKVSDFQAEMLAQIDITKAGQALAADVRYKFEQALAKAGVPDDQRRERAEAFNAEWTRVSAADAARDLIERTILNPASVAIEKQFAEQPLLEATLRTTLASRYAALGLYDQSVALQRQALETRRRIQGDDDPETIACMKGLGNTLRVNANFPEAEQLLREAVERSRRVLGEEHAETLYALNSWVVFLLGAGRYTEAEAPARDVLERGRRVLGDDHLETVTFIANVGSVLRALGKLDQAEPFYREALEAHRRVLGDDHLLTLDSMSNLGLLMVLQGKYALAEPYYLEVLDKRRRLLGQEHPTTVMTLGKLGGLYLGQNRLLDAETCDREVLTLRRRTLGNDHLDTVRAICELATLLQRQGKPGEAELLLREAMETGRRTFGDDHPQTLVAMSNMASVLLDQNKLTAETEALCRELLERRRRVLGSDHPDTLVSCNILGSVYMRQRKFAETEPFWREAYETSLRLRGPENPDTLTFASNLANLLRDQSKLSEAETMYRDVIATSERTQGPDNRFAINAKMNLSTLLMLDKRYAETLELLTPVEGTVRRMYTGSNARVTALMLNKMGQCRLKLGQYPESKGNLLEAYSMLLETRGPVHRDTRTCVQTLVNLYTTWDAEHPGKGHDVGKVEWTAKLAEIDAASPPSPAGDAR